MAANTASTARSGRFLTIGLGILAVVGIVSALIAVRAANDRSAQIDQLTEDVAAVSNERDQLTEDVAAVSNERDELSTEVARVQSSSLVNQSRWLAAIAVGGQYSPSQSRLLAVEAVTRSPTPEATGAIGNLLFADPRTQPPIVELEHDGPVWVAAAGFSDDIVATGSHDTTAKVWTSSGELLATLATPGRVQSVELSPDDRFVATGSHDGTAAAWTVAGEQVASVMHDDRVNDVALSSDSALMVSGGHDGLALVTDIETGEIRHQLTHPDLVWTVAFSEDDQRVATGGQDGQARVWDVETGNEVAVYDLDKPVATLDFSPDGLWLFVGGQGDEAILINTADGEAAPPLEGAMRGGILGVDWHPDGTELALVSLGGVHRFELPAMTLIAEHQVPGGTRGVAYGPDGSWFVSGSGDFQFSFGQIAFWDTLTGSQMVSLNLGGPVETIHVDSKGTVLAGFRMVEDLVEIGGAWLVPGPEKWIGLACAESDGVIGAQAWGELTGESGSHETGCP